MILINDSLISEYKIPKNPIEAFPIVFAIQNGETFRIFDEESLNELKEVIDILIEKIKKQKEENAISSV